MSSNTRKVIAQIIHGENIVFNSIQECCDYFNSYTLKKLYPVKVQRCIDDGDFWNLTEIVIANGQRVVESHQVFFDELYEGGEVAPYKERKERKRY